MVYGNQIGKKFETDGSPRTYPGNTVIADISCGCSAYELMRGLRDMAYRHELSNKLIFLPEDSYHVTILRGLNDQVREDDFWPKALSKSAPMDQADDYIAKAVAKVAMPGPIRMAFTGVRLDETDFRVLLRPADDEQMAVLKDFRDRAAEAIGLHLPGHAAYAYHITLAYTLVLPQSGQIACIEELCKKMDEALAEQGTFETSPPYMAYYNNMMKFSKERLNRSGKES